MLVEVWFEMKLLSNRMFPPSAFTPSIRLRSTRLPVKFPLAVASQSPAHDEPIAVEKGLKVETTRTSGRPAGRVKIPLPKIRCVVAVPVCREGVPGEHGSTVVGHHDADSFEIGLGIARWRSCGRFLVTREPNRVVPQDGGPRHDQDIPPVAPLNDGVRDGHV